MKVLRRIKHTTRWLIAEGLYRTGFLQLWIRRTLRGRAVVLTYHRVLSATDAAESWSNPAIIVSPATFERQMASMRSHFTMLSIDEFEAHVSSQRPFDSPSCLVTFDDGWHDTFSEAWPILQRHRAPAVVFLAARFIGSNDTFWQEHLGALLCQTCDRARTDPKFAEQARNTLAAWQLQAVVDLPQQNVREAVFDIVQHRKLTAPSGGEPIAALTELLGGARSSRVDSFMTWEHVCQMAGDGVAFGGHGATHRRLTTLTTPEVEHEVRDSRDILEERLGRPVMAFCYPNGDWNPEVADVVRKERFRIAFSTERGVVDGDTNVFAVRRVNVHEDMTHSVPMFLARVAGLL